MKTRWFWMALVTVLALGTAFTLRAQANKTKEVMKFKLHYAQRVLEGITMENFEVIGDNAKKLRGLSQQAGWEIKETPEYQKFTTDFARHAEALEKAAANKNVDAATVAYFQLTVSCTTCHRYLRGGAKAVGSITIPKKNSAAFLARLDATNHKETE